jgi:hypothetical protein
MVVSLTLVVFGGFCSNKHSETLGDGDTDME